MKPFTVGSLAVYPAHGVGKITRIDSRLIGGVDHDFYVLQILSSGATLMVPATSCERAGMRGLASAEEIANVYTILRSPGRVSHTTWNRRFREFSDKIRCGVLTEVAEVLRDLNAANLDKDLSFGEKKMLNKAITLIAEIAEEIGASTGQSLEVAEELVYTALEDERA